MAKNERVRCFYCGDPVLPGRVEYDHFPIPAECGGTHVVPACSQCHDLKDRTHFDDLPGEFKEAFIEQFARLPREAKIVYAQGLQVSFRALTQPELDGLTRPEEPKEPKPAGRPTWLMVMSLVRTIEQLEKDSKALERYSEFVTDCASVKNYEGWQGEYFQRAREIVRSRYLEH